MFKIASAVRPIQMRFIGIHDFQHKQVRVRTTVNHGPFAKSRTSIAACSGMTEHITPFLTLWIQIYAGLISIYFVFGYLVEVCNKFIQDKRIQSRDCKPELIRRDIVQSTKSLLSIAFFLAMGLHLRRSGLGITPSELNVWSFIGYLVLSMLLFDTWFYWMHRLIHVKPLYRWAHSWHHRSVTPTVWSNNSDTLLDNLFLQSYWLICFLVLPAPTVVFIVHKLYDQITGMIGHSGYEYAAGKLSLFPSPLIGTTFHDQHHEFFLYNYATHFSIWDRLMNTIHPNYEPKINSFSEPSPRSEKKSTPTIDKGQRTNSSPA